MWFAPWLMDVIGLSIAVMLVCFGIAAIIWARSKFYSDDPKYVP